MFIEILKEQMNRQDKMKIVAMQIPSKLSLSEQSELRKILMDCDTELEIKKKAKEYLKNK